VVIAMGSHARDWVNDHVLDGELDWNSNAMVMTDRVYLCIPHYSYLMRQGDYDGEVGKLRSRLKMVTPDEVHE
jgi:hypothetical protein